MNGGFIWFNRGTKCLFRLMVSIDSFRMHNPDVPACVLTDDNPPDWFREFLRECSVDLKTIPRSPTGALSAKAALWRWSPYEQNIYLDADTIVQKNLYPLFTKLVGSTSGILGVRFSDWKTDGRRVSARIQSWSSLVSSSQIDAALRYGPAINTGVFGFDRIDGREFLEKWEELAALGDRNPHVHRRTIDEIAFQLLLPAYVSASEIVGDGWNRSVTHGTVPAHEAPILHFHGGKHLLSSEPACKLWKKAFTDARNRHAALRRMDTLGDGNLQEYVNARIRDDVTVVCAVDEQYARRLWLNFQKWMDVDGLRELQYLIIAVGCDANHPVFRPFFDYDNVQIQAFTPHPEAGPRERAFSGFIFGAAEHVTTPYWMKIDADVRPNPDNPDPVFDWPDYRPFTITSDSWHYTRVKGDPNAKKHWLNTLDEFWGGEPLYPPNIPVDALFKHRRFRSFCWIEKTEFTRRLVQKIGDRLPIPSQDTTACDAARRWNEPVQAFNFRKCVKP